MLDPRISATFAAVFVAAAPAWPAAADQAPFAPRRLSETEILAAMEKSGGYDLTATANGPRLQQEVVVRLIEEAERGDPERRPLLIGHREWYQAFLRRTRLAPAQAPLYVRLSYEIGQDLLVDYRREDVVEAVTKGPPPLIVANMCLFWPRAPGKPDRYSYDDVASDPRLRVTQKRLVTYRLVYYGDRVWFADVHGLRGRPTSGALGALFAVIGEANVVESRSAIALDGTQVIRGRARKWGFDRTETVTLSPSGRARRGIPPGRPDLTTLERRLDQPLSIRFRPFDADEPPPSSRRALGDAAGYTDRASAAFSSRSFSCTMRTFRGPIRRSCFWAAVRPSRRGSAQR